MAQRVYRHDGLTVRPVAERRAQRMRRMCTLCTRPSRANHVIRLRAAVGDERHRQAGDRHDLDRHPDVLEHLPEQHREHAGAEVRAEHVARQVGDAPDAHEHDDEQRTAATAQPTRPNCSPTAANGKSAQMTGMSRPLVSGPCSQPLPNTPPVPTARTALSTWYTVLLQVGVVLVEEDADAGQLVVVDEARRRTRRRPWRATAG